MSSCFSCLTKITNEVFEPSKPTKLDIFLLGTLDNHSFLTKLRGYSPILKKIWIYACSEWWSLHIQNYSSLKPVFYVNDYFSGVESLNYNGFISQEKFSDGIPILDYNIKAETKGFVGCPIVRLNCVDFPPIDEGLEPLNVNMMPFNLCEPESTLPSYLHGYLDIIKNCSSNIYKCQNYEYSKHVDQDGLIAYLTVDERPVSCEGSSQRRGGVHLESPGALRTRELSDKSLYTPDLSFTHGWGRVAHSNINNLVNGIYMASNMDNTTSIWNAQINDTFGDIIGPHGSLERCRDLLGDPIILKAGELIWLTDHTPHESLPVTDISKRRQFFRLVVGEIGFWFTAHNTPNLLCTLPFPSSVIIIDGDKFELARKEVPIIWEYGSEKEIESARKEAEFRHLLYNHCIGFIADDLLRAGIYNFETLQKKFLSWI